MPDPLFRLVCAPAALAGAPADWTGAMLAEGEVALLVDDGGLDAVTALAHELDVAAVRLLRPERDAERQEETAIAYAASKPLVWVAAGFSERATEWAHRRGPMTLLVEADGALDDGERRRMERFVAILGRQAE